MRRGTSSNTTTIAIIAGLGFFVVAVAAAVFVLNGEIGNATLIGPEHYSSRRNKAAEEVAIAHLETISAFGKVEHVTSADLSDCLIWSSDEKSSDAVKRKYSTYFRPTNLKGTAVLTIHRDGTKWVSLVNSSGEHVRLLFPDCVKLNGGKKARDSNRPTTNGLHPDADPVKDNFQRSQKH